MLLPDIKLSKTQISLHFSKGCNLREFQLKSPPKHNFLINLSTVHCLAKGGSGEYSEKTDTSVEGDVILLPSLYSSDEKRGSGH